MLRRVLIENYRSCLRTSIDLHPKLSVLIGPNGSGKTNILQAIMFLNKMAEEESLGRSRRAVLPASSRIRAEFQQSDSEVRLAATVSARTNQSNNDIMVASRQKWLVKSTNGRTYSTDLPLAVASHLAQSSHDPYRYYSYSSSRYSYMHVRLGQEIPKWVRARLGRVGAFCLGMKYYGASQFTNPGNCPPSFHIEEEGKRRSLSRYHGHSKILYSMYSAEKADSKHRYQQFIDIVGPNGLHLIDDLKFREVQTSSTDYSVRVGGRVEARKRNRLLVIPQFRIGKQKLSPNQLSEGTFKTLALLFHVITDEGSALLIEEPEVCVHQGLLSSILELVKSASTNKQMIISTHSDYVLDRVDPDNVYRVRFEKSKGTVARHIRKTMTKREYSALREYLQQDGNLGEYWREGGLGDRS
jgi:ABC-type lipoprotein export system ATPase subunit